MPEPYIRARDLAKVYQSGSSQLVVFSDLNLDVERGEMLALVGESGAGKSTLLHLLGGLDRPSRGAIYYESTEISGLSDGAILNPRKYTFAHSTYGRARIHLRSVGLYPHR